MWINGIKFDLIWAVRQSYCAGGFEKLRQPQWHNLVDEKREKTRNKKRENFDNHFVLPKSCCQCFHGCWQTRQCFFCVIPFQLNSTQEQSWTELSERSCPSLLISSLRLAHANFSSNILATKASSLLPPCVDIWVWKEGFSTLRQQADRAGPAICQDQGAREN